MSDTAREWALCLAGLGFKIAPLPPGSKRPVVKWKDVMTSDPEVIGAWFDERPDMNYLVCGGDRYAVVDLDQKPEEGRRGIDDFRELEMFNGSASETFTVRSPSGGLHLYYIVPHGLGNSTRKLPSGIDIRGSGGYVVGPGCRTPDGAYEQYSTHAIKDMPEWLLALTAEAGERAEDSQDPMYELDLPAAVQRATEWLQSREPAVEGQNGHDHTYATACGVKDFGVSEDMCLSLLVESGWNSRCDPPWDAAELGEVVSHAYQYGNQRPGVKGGVLMDLALEGEEEVHHLDPDEERDSAEDKFRQHVFRGGEVFQRNKRREFIIPEWLIDTGMTALLATRGTGKTVTMLDMAARIAGDMDWHGMPVDPGWHVIYFCGEDDAGTEEHLRAWCLHHGVGYADLTQRFIFLDIAADLMDPDQVKLAAKVLRGILGKEGRAVTFLDTWQRSTWRASQNDDEEMQRAVHHAEAFSKIMRGPMVAAFHPPDSNPNKVIGSTVQENVTSAILNLTSAPQGRYKKLEVTRIKGPGLGNYRLLDFEKMELGEEDRFGRPRTGLVPVSVGGNDIPISPEVQSDEERERTALGAILKEVEANRKTYAPKSHHLTMSLAAKIIATTLDKSEPDEWDQWLAERFEETGVRGRGERAIRSSISAVFDPKERPGGYSVNDDGDTFNVRLRPVSKRETKIVIMPEEYPSEDDEESI